MGKKKKEKSLLRSSSFFSNEEDTNFQDEIIQHLQLLKESNWLVIGFNAVLRGIEKNFLCAVIYISRRGTSAMYHALNLMCKDRDLLLLQLQDINFVVFNLEIRSSTCYGIKKSVLDQPQFSKFQENINIARNSRKSQKDKVIEKSCSKDKEFCVESQGPYEDIKSENSYEKNDVICVIHSKHDLPKQKCTGKEGMLNFQEVDFPNYKTIFNSISISIK